MAKKNKAKVKNKPNKNYDDVSEYNARDMIKHIKDIELGTEYGRINWGCFKLLMMLYIGATTIPVCVDLAVSAVKTWVLKQNIPTQLRDTSYVYLAVAVIVMIFCVLFVYWGERMKISVHKKIRDANNSNGKSKNSNSEEDDDSKS